MFWSFASSGPVVLQGAARGPTSRLAAFSAETLYRIRVPANRLPDKLLPLS